MISGPEQKRAWQKLGDQQVSPLPVVFFFFTLTLLLRSELETFHHHKKI